jgi:hypothetical protein
MRMMKRLGAHTYGGDPFQRPEVPVKKYMPEFAAVPITLVVLGLLFLVLWAFDAGLAAWIAVGAIGLAALIVVIVIAMRRPRSVVASGGAGRFDGAAPHVDDGVHRVLVVTHSACSAADLGDLAAANGATTSALVVAPALSSRLGRWTGDEGAYRQAEENLAATVQALNGAGIEASGHVGSHDPLQAADDGLREFPADEVVFVMHGDDEKNWLEQGVLDSARERYPVPVRELVSG